MGSHRFPISQAQEEKAKLQKRRERQKSDASDVSWREVAQETGDLTWFKHQNYGFMMVYDGFMYDGLWWFMMVYSLYQTGI